MAFIPLIAGAVSAVGQIANASKGGASAGGVPQAAQFVTQGQAYRGNDQTQTGILDQQKFVDAYNGINGIQNQANVFGQQQGLANQLQGVANGTGPNPALAQLNQTTGQSVANQAALMAGQRGSSANAGLIARQAGMQGGALQQQAAGQGATMQAQQQLAAMSALQNQQGLMAGTAGSQIAGQQNAMNSYQNAAQNQYSAMLGSGGQQNQAAIQNANMQNQYQMNQQGNMGKILGGISNAAGAGAGLFGGGGSTGANPTTQGGTSALGNNYSMMASGGEVKSKVGQHLCMNQGGMAMKQGGHVPGSANVGGDSLKNDTVKAMLSPGEIVIPRSVAQHPDAANEAAKFVAAIKAKGRR